MSIYTDAFGLIDADPGDHWFTVEWYEPRKGGPRPEDEDFDCIDDNEEFAEIFRTRDEAVTHGRTVGPSSYWGAAAVSEVSFDLLEGNAYTTEIISSWDEPSS